jgi:hypothetical protein
MEVDSQGIDTCPNDKCEGSLCIISASITTNSCAAEKCADKSNCTTCAKVKGCGWCGKTQTCHDMLSPVDQQCPGCEIGCAKMDVKQCPASPAPEFKCETVKGCKACTATANCGWCVKDATCKEANTVNLGTCEECKGFDCFKTFQSVPDRCPADDTATSRCMYKNCSTCTADPGCGWCGDDGDNGGCKEAGAAGGKCKDGKCDIWAYGDCNAVCQQQSACDSCTTATEKNRDVKCAWCGGHFSKGSDRSQTGCFIASKDGKGVASARAPLYIPSCKVTVTATQGTCAKCSSYKELVKAASGAMVTKVLYDKCYKDPRCGACDVDPRAMPGHNQAPCQVCFCFVFCCVFLLCVFVSKGLTVHVSFHMSTALTFFTHTHTHIHKHTHSHTHTTYTGG